MHTKDLKKAHNFHVLIYLIFFVNRTLALNETTNNTKYPKKNENYSGILEKPFIFNLQTVSTAHRRCCSSLSRPDVIGERIVWAPRGGGGE
jgi:hypothetical protein